MQIGGGDCGYAVTRGDLVEGDFIDREVYDSTTRGDQPVLVIIRYRRTTDGTTVKVLDKAG
jgi:hypothetical protein